MPALLPTNLTADRQAAESQDFSPLPLIQALSFFVAVFLACALGFQKLWNSVRPDFPAMPQLTYARSVGLVLLWGLLFVVVLTMISGARELMTPGAWRKQGWAYTLDAPAPAKPADDERYRAMERLKIALWQYARDHEGGFPAKADDSIDPALWDFVRWDGLKLRYVPGRNPDDAGRVLAYEPEIDGERLVLLTNGAIARMHSRDLERLLPTAEERP